MKKILLLALVVISLNGFAQTNKTWNFSESPFGADGMTGIDFKKTNVIDGLTIGSTEASPFAIDANSKTLNDIKYTHRLKSGGGGSPAEGSKIPTTRYLKIDVAGNSTINIAMMSSSSSAERVLVIVNTDETYSATIPSISGSALANYTHEYVGGPTSLYFYSENSGINYYSFSATNLATSSINTIDANKTIVSQKYYDVLGREIQNNSRGLVIRKVTYDDGTSASLKTYIRTER